MMEFVSPYILIVCLQCHFDGEQKVVVAKSGSELYINYILSHKADSLLRTDL